MPELNKINVTSGTVLVSRVIGNIEPVFVLMARVPFIEKGYALILSMVFLNSDTLASL